MEAPFAARLQRHALRFYFFFVMASYLSRHLAEGRTASSIETIKKKRGGVAATALQCFEGSMIRFSDHALLIPTSSGSAYKAPPVTPLHPAEPVPAAAILLVLRTARYFAVMTDDQVDGSGLKAAF